MYADVNISDGWPHICIVPFSLAYLVQIVAYDHDFVSTPLFVLRISYAARISWNKPLSATLQAAAT